MTDPQTIERIRGLLEKHRQGEQGYDRLYCAGIVFSHAESLLADAEKVADLLAENETQAECIADLSARLAKAVAMTPERINRENPC